ncbi:MAG: phosphate starvation-inducible protein PhoH, partial [Gammaproteobacteria bacterium]|nr:phosphate starvation-inducible protein PhoH [Gammaproteobacteria bacterium]
MKTSQSNIQDLILEPADNARLASLCGELDEHLRQIERRLGVQINYRGHEFCVIGEPASAKAGREVLEALFNESADREIDAKRVHLCLQSATEQLHDKPITSDVEASELRMRHGTIKARSVNQSHYLKNLTEFDVNFGIGPAGTGKTYLAVATAVQ